MAIDIFADMNKKMGNRLNANPSESRPPIDIFSDMRKKKESEALTRANEFRKNNPMLSGAADVLNKGITKGAEFLSRNPKIGGLVQGAANIAQPVNEFIEGAGIPQLAGGALEGLGNTAISVGNVPVSIAELLSGKDLQNYKVPHLNFGQYMPEGSAIGYEAGKFLGPLLTGAGAIGRAQEVARPGGYAGILSDILKGAGIGYATGETSEGERGIGAALGGIFGGLRGLTNRSTANRIVNDMENTRNAYGNAYRNLFRTATDNGINNIQTPNINLNSIVSNSSPRFHRSLDTFIARPTLENAHRAQSDMGKFAAHLNKLERNNPLTSEQHRALRDALDAQRRIRGSMFSAFQRNRRPDLAQNYQDLTTGYAEDVIPYTRNKPIRDFAEGRISAKEMTKKLRGHEEFLNQLGEHYPELQLNETLKKVGTGTAKGLGILGLGYGGHRILEKVTGR